MDEPQILYEDKNFLAVYKPAGLLVHPIKTRSGSFKEPTLVDWILKKYPEISRVGDDPEWRPGIVHRLDRATSGVMIVPKNQKYFEYLKSLFQKGEIRKTYLALTFGSIHQKKGTIEKAIGIGKSTVKRSVHSQKMLKEAKTNFEVLNFKKIEGEMYTLLKITPETGRTHQIRVHLSYIGHSVVGDSLYGPKKQPNWVKRLMLHALSLEFTSEDGKRIKLESLIPVDFSAIGFIGDSV